MQRFGDSMREEFQVHRMCQMYQLAEYIQDTARSNFVIVCHVKSREQDAKSRSQDRNTRSQDTESRIQVKESGTRCNESKTRRRFPTMIFSSAVAYGRSQLFPILPGDGVVAEHNRFVLLIIVATLFTHVPLFASNVRLINIATAGLTRHSC